MPATNSIRPVSRPFRWIIAIATVAVVAITAGCASDTASTAGGQSGDEITFPIGIVTSLSGPNAETGVDASEAINAFVEWNNTKSTGVRFEIVGTQDDAGDAAAGRQAVGQLISQGAKAIVGDSNSTVAEAAAPLALQQGALYIMSASWADDLTGPDKPLAFRITASNSGLAREGFLPYLEYLSEKGELSTLGILTEDTSYGIGQTEQIMKLAAESIPGLRIVNEQFSSTNTDVTGQLIKLKAAGPQLVIISAVGAARNTAVPQARQVGITVPLLAAWNWPTYSDFWDAAGSSGVGIQYIDTDSPTREATEMYTTMEDVIGRRPTIWGAWAWDGMVALREAILAAGSNDPAAVAAALESVDFDGASGPVAFDTASDNFHNRKTLPVFVLQLDVEDAPGSDAIQIFPVS